MMSTKWKVALASLLLVACKLTTAPCKPGTLFVQLTLDGTSATADSLQVTVDLGGGTLLHGTPIAHQPGVSSGSVEVHFAPGYPAGQQVAVTVDALVGASIIGSGQQTLTLTSSCQSLSIAIAASAGDMGGGDGPDGNLSGCNSDSDCATGHCADGVCCDVACQGQCEACNLPATLGVCSPVTGAPKAGHMPCASASKVCAGSCDGTNRTGCAYPGATTQCQAQSCSAGIKVLTTYCDGAGNCPTAAPLTCTPAMCNSAGTDCASTCMGDGDCASVSGKPYCDHGVCTTLKPNGRSCGSSAECTNGNCVDGVCCDQACGGQCQACDVAGSIGTCTPITSGAPHGTRAACTGSGTTCGGSCAAGQTQVCTYPTVTCGGGTCSLGQYSAPVACVSGMCPTVTKMTCPGNFACNVAGTACKVGPCAADTDCQAGYFCSSAGGGTCVAQHVKGDACNLMADCEGMSNCRECTTLNCADGYCCDMPCQGQCQACNITPGTCKPTPAGNQPVSPRAACGGTGSCKGSCDGTTTSACTFPTTQCTPQTCSAGVVTFATACSNGSCVAPTPPTQTCTSGQCDPTTPSICKSGCTADAQCGANQYCNAAGTCATSLSQGSACNLLSNGTNSACYNSANCAQCATGLTCADGVCCDSACSGLCQACNASGQCKTLTSGQPVSDATTKRSACTGTGTCQEACNGTSATSCSDVNAGVSCAAATCTFNASTGHYESTAAQACSGGSCPTAAPTSCGLYVCNGSACYSGCTADNQCLSGNYCANNGTGPGVCKPQIAAGASCSAANCYSGSCAQCTGSNVCSRDGVCCNTACNGPCQTCLATPGTCTNVPLNGTPIPATACNGAFACSGKCNGTSGSCDFTGTDNNGCSFCGTCSGGVCAGGNGQTCGTSTHCCCGCTGGSPNKCALCM